MCSHEGLPCPGARCGCECMNCLDRDPEVQEVCQYSAAHVFREIPATTTINLAPGLPEIPACDACARFYATH